MDNSLVTWLLVVVCTPHCIRNPYLIAKIIEVLFVINPNVQVSIKKYIYYRYIRKYKIAIIYILEYRNTHARARAYTHTHFLDV